MNHQFIDIGYSSYIDISKIVAVLNPESDPIRRQIEIAEKEHRLYKATYGRKAESVLITDNDKLYLSALKPKIIIERIKDLDKKVSLKNKK